MRVQSEISDFGFEMQDSSNFKFPFCSFAGWPVSLAEIIGEYLNVFVG